MNKQIIKSPEYSGFVVFNQLDIATAKKHVDALNGYDYFANRVATNKQKKPLKIENLDGDFAAHIYIDDVISKYYGISAADIVAAFDEVGNKDVILHINCGGGDVMQAREICATIANHKGKVEARIDALCASAATFITCACDSVVMNEGGLFMIHNASGFCWGDYSAMIKKSELLLKISDTIASDYVVRTGKSKADILQLMQDETYYTAQEALDNGFIDEIFKTAQDGDAENLANLGFDAIAPEAGKAPEKPKPDITEPPMNFGKEKFAAKLRYHQLSGNA